MAKEPTLSAIETAAYKARPSVLPGLSRTAAGPPAEEKGLARPSHGCATRSGICSVDNAARGARTECACAPGLAACTAMHLARNCR